MRPIGIFRKWLLGPPVKGIWAIAAAIAAIALPTTIRLVVAGNISGSAFTPYIPFVLLSAILIGWRWAVVVVLGAWIVSDLLFFGPRGELLDSASEAVGVSLFLLASSLIIWLVEFTRSIVGQIAMIIEPTVYERGIIFSLERGQAWASWYGAGLPVHLGTEEEVAAKMQDFLAQLEVGRRLSRVAASVAS